MNTTLLPTESRKLAQKEKVITVQYKKDVLTDAQLIALAEAQNMSPLDIIEYHMRLAHAVGDSDRAVYYASKAAPYRHVKKIEAPSNAEQFPAAIQFLFKKNVTLDIPSSIEAVPQQAIEAAK